MFFAARPTRSTTLGLLAVAAFGLSGCQSVQSTSPASPELRLYDASPDSPGLDFALNANTLAYNLGPGTQTSYVPVAAGSYTLSAVRDGSSQVLATTGIGVTGSNHYTAFAGNIQANLQLTVLTDQATSAPGNQISVRVVDEATAVGAVDVYFVPQSGKLITTAPLFVNVTFGSVMGYTSITAGTYQIVLLPTGTVPIATTIALATGPSVTYASGIARTFVLLNNSQQTTPPATIDTLQDYNPPG